MKVDLKITGGKCVLIDGPASIIIKEGKANIFAAPIMNGNKLIVKKGKRIPLDCLTYCSITLNLMNKDQFTILDSSSIPDRWQKIAVNLTNKIPQKIIVIGENDTGKSSLCAYLSNIFIRKTGKINILDMDLGQSDLGPPTTMGLGVIERFIMSLEEIKIINLYFVGSITPSKSLTRIFRGVKKLLSVNIENFPTIINTDGWISDEFALQYKLKLMEILRPNIVIGVGHAVDKILDILKVFSIQVHSPLNLLKKSREDRKAIRQRKFHHYFKNGKIRKYNLSKVVYRSARALGGARSNYLVGLLDSNEWLLALGILKDFDDTSNFVTIYTNFLGKVRYIDEGYIKIDEKGRETKNIKMPFLN